MEFRLLDLPNELIAQISEYIPDTATLRNLARTCRRVQHLVESLIWRHLLIRSEKTSNAVLNAFRARQERALAVQSLYIPCDSKARQDLGAVSRVMTRAKGVETLMIESPSCGCRYFEKEKAWILMTDHLFWPFQCAVGGDGISARPLQRLKKLTLHLNGPESPYWTLDHRSLPIFLHPTLQEVKVSCMNLPGHPFDGLEEEQASTPLKHLILEECNISHSGLSGFLSLPKALETLHLGENCQNFRQFPDAIEFGLNELFDEKPFETLEALSKQKHSLKNLTYAASAIQAPPYRRLRHRRQDTPLIDGAFTDFQSLEKVSLVGSCSMFERAMLCSRAPPNLRELIAETSEPLTEQPRFTPSLPAEDILKGIPFLRIPSAAVSSTLKLLTLVYDPWHSNSRPQDIRDHQSDVRAAARVAFKTFGITLRVHYVNRGHYYPPFLYGEPQPTMKLFYDGAEDRFSEEIADEILTEGNVYHPGHYTRS